MIIFAGKPRYVMAHTIHTVLNITYLKTHPADLTADSTAILPS